MRPKLWKMGRERGSETPFLLSQALSESLANVIRSVCVVTVRVPDASVYVASRVCLAGHPGGRSDAPRREERRRLVRVPGQVCSGVARRTVPLSAP
jgi:hypothetical protein